ncbi:MAG TPA: peptide chain release factor 1 [Candidatus Latescibacteria bacterium]|nr:peptide chain release factor 1 [Candidatus Latescibacterota bacterium]
MLDRLAAIETRFTEIERLLSDPAATADIAQYQKLAKEHRQLAPIVETGRRYADVLAQLAEARRILEEEQDRDLIALAKEEIAVLEDRVATLEETLREQLIPKDPNDDRNTILEIRGGTGGDEAALFAADLFRMYSRYAESKGWSLEVMSTSEASAGGLKEVIAQISGEGAYGRLKYESGVHRVQRVPATEAQGRIHTSTASVAVLPEADDVEVEIDPADLRIDVFRSSGPGGQSVNTADSAIRITHLPTGLVVQCQDERSQLKNKAKAMKVLRARLLDRAITQQQSEEAAARRAQVGTGERSEKIRTYNFPQSRVTDHRIKLTVHNLSEILDGNLDELIEALRMADRANQLQHPSAEDD